MNSPPQKKTNNITLAASSCSSSHIFNDNLLVHKLKTDIHSALNSTFNIQKSFYKNIYLCKCTHTLPLSHPPSVQIEVRGQLQEFFPSTNPVCRAWQQKVAYWVTLLALPKQMLNSVLLSLPEHIGGHACQWWMCAGQRQLWFFEFQGSHSGC